MCPDIDRDVVPSNEVKVGMMSWDNKNTFPITFSQTYASKINKYNIKKSREKKGSE